MDVVGELSAEEHVLTHSRRRSKIQPRLLQYMDKIGKEVTIYEISRGTGICYSSVYGAINGRRDHYCKVSSLLSMGLVKARRLDNNMKLFSLTEKGHDEVRLINLQEDYHDRGVQLV